FEPPQLRYQPNRLALIGLYAIEPPIQIQQSFIGQQEFRVCEARIRALVQNEMRIFGAAEVGFGRCDLDVLEQLPHRKHYWPYRRFVHENLVYFAAHFNGRFDRKQDQTGINHRGSGLRKWGCTSCITINEALIWAIPEPCVLICRADMLAKKSHST